MAKRKRTKRTVKKLTDRDKKAIIEKETFCRTCSKDGKRVVAAFVNDKGVPLCREHGD